MAQSDGDDLHDIDYHIIEEKEPDQFIDLLCANNFFAGNLNGKIPTARNRIIFEKWLDRYRKQHELELLDRLEKDLENTPLAYAIEAGDARNAWNTKSVHEAIQTERERLGK